MTKINRRQVAVDMALAMVSKGWILQQHFEKYTDDMESALAENVTISTAFSAADIFDSETRIGLRRAVKLLRAERLKNKDYSEW